MVTIKARGSIARRRVLLTLAFGTLVALNGGCSGIKTKHVAFATAAGAVAAGAFTGGALPVILAALDGGSIVGGAVDAIAGTGAEADVEEIQAFLGQTARLAAKFHATTTGEMDGVSVELTPDTMERRNGKGSQAGFFVSVYDHEQVIPIEHDKFVPAAHLRRLLEGDLPSGECTIRLQDPRGSEEDLRATTQQKDGCKVVLERTNAGVQRAKWSPY